VMWPWPLRRGAEQTTVLAQVEAIAPRLDDPPTADAPSRPCRVA
jgi:hypothetical protein